MTMNSRQLAYFLAIVDEGGVGNAAAALRIAQPSLSRALQGLERDLGVPLFHRIGRGLVLSPAGEALVDPARLVLRDLRQAERSVVDVRTLAGGQLDIASLATLAADPVAGMIGGFRRRYPGVGVSLADPETGSAVGALVRSGECELGFAHIPPLAKDLVVRPLAVQRLVVVTPPSRRTQSARPRPLGLAALARLAWVVTPVGTSTRTLLDETLHGLGETPTIAVEVTQREAIVPLVLAGAGAALLPENLAQDAQRRGVVVRTTTPAVERRIGIVHRDAPLSPAAAAFLALAVPKTS